jgi:hypothetical protein
LGKEGASFPVVAGFIAYPEYIILYYYLYSIKKGSVNQHLPTAYNETVGKVVFGKTGSSGSPNRSSKFFKQYPLPALGGV